MKFSIIFISLILFLSPSVVLSQSTFPLPVVWLKAETADNNNSVLKNFRQNLHQFENVQIQYTNYHPVPQLDFSEINSLTIPIDNLKEVTVFSVYKSSLTDEEQFLWTCGSGQSSSIIASNFRFGNLHDNTEFNFTGLDNSWLRINTHFINLKNLSSNESFNFKLGKSTVPPISSFNGIMPEVMVYDKVLSKTQRKQVETYLSLKYGIPLISRGSLTYLNSKGKQIWNANDNGNFRHRIAGIVRDDFWQLYQKQATSTYEPGLISIALNTFHKDNESNNGEIEDLTYLIWADNNQALSSNQNSKNILERCWQVSISEGFNALTQLRLGIRQLKDELNKDEQFWLVIDRSGSNTFLLNNTDYYKSLAAKATREYAFYEEIQWGTKESNKEIFTFKKGKDLLMVAEAPNLDCKENLTGSISFKAYGGQPPYTFRFSNWQQHDVLPGEIYTIEDLTIGSYEIEVTDATGLRSVEEVELNYSDLIEPDLLKRQYKIQNDEALELNMSDACETCNFLWRLPDGTEQSGAELQSSLVGEYALVVEKNGCSNTYNFLVSNISSVFQSVELWGNPSKDGDHILEIRLWEAEPVLLKIFNNEGKFIKQRKLPLNHYHKLSETGLKTGIYRIQVIVAGESISKSLIII